MPFYGATVELDVADQVTTFTASEFGGTFCTDRRGSDHWWRSHHVGVDGGVRGRRFYGTLRTLVVNGPEDTAALARWFGVAGNDLPVVVR